MANAITRNEARTIWIEALRSGRYQQTQGYLHRIKPGDNGEPVGFCCLGVACDLFAEHLGLTRYSHWYVVLDGIPQEHAIEAFEDALDQKTYALPQTVIDFLGLEDGEGKPRPGTLAERRLSSLNDEGSTFAEIADILESGDYWRTES